MESLVRLSFLGIFREREDMERDYQNILEKVKGNDRRYCEAEYQPTEGEFEVIARVQHFLEDLGNEETPLQIENVSPNFAFFTSPDVLKISFFWDLKGITDHNVNPLEIRVIKPLINMLTVLRYPIHRFEMHDYGIGMTVMVFSKC